MNKKAFSFFLLGAVLLVGLSIYSKATAQVTTVGPGDLGGQAWSDQIGWINFDGKDPGAASEGRDYAVSLTASDTVDPAKSYAFSKSIGWINFNPTISAADKLNELSPSTDGAAAHLIPDGANFKLIGWARACAVFAKDSTGKTTCSGSLDTSARGGWDGWIALNGRDASGKDYFVTYNPVTKNFGGNAWGGDVIGNISFAGTISGGGVYAVKLVKNPFIKTLPATQITQTSATLNGDYNSNTAPGNFTTFFEYDIKGNPTLFSKQSSLKVQPNLAVGTTSASITGLTKNKTYEYRAVVVNQGGFRVAVGDPQPFPTPADPTFTSCAAANINTTEVTIKGDVTLNTLPAGFYQILQRKSGTTNTFQPFPSGPTPNPVAISADQPVTLKLLVSSLTPGAKYDVVCAASLTSPLVGTGLAGTLFGPTATSFTFTAPSAPTVSFAPGFVLAGNKCNTNSITPSFGLSITPNNNSDYRGGLIIKDLTDPTVTIPPVPAGLKQATPVISAIPSSTFTVGHTYEFTPTVDVLDSAGTTVVQKRGALCTFVAAAEVGNPATSPQASAAAKNIDVTFLADRPEASTQIDIAFAPGSKNLGTKAVFALDTPYQIAVPPTVSPTSGTNTANLDLSKLTGEARTNALKAIATKGATIQVVESSPSRNTILGYTKKLESRQVPITGNYVDTASGVKKNDAVKSDPISITGANAKPKFGVQIPKSLPTGIYDIYLKVLDASGKTVFDSNDSTLSTPLRIHVKLNVTDRTPNVSE